MICACCICSALTLLATVFDFEDWHFHAYPGYKPFPTVERVQGPADGSLALHVTNVTGASGTAMEGLPRIAAEVGDVIVTDMKVKGSGIVSASHFRQLANGGWNQSSVSIYRKLTDDWCDFHSEIDVQDGTKGPTSFVTPVIGARKGSEFWVSDIRVRRLRKRKPDIGETSADELLAEETYDRSDALRVGNPRIVREPFAPAIETRVGQGRYTVKKPVDLSLRESYPLPAERTRFFRTSVRIYDFGGGRVVQSVSGESGRLSAAVAPAREGYHCLFSHRGRTVGALDLPHDCLPADFALSVDADGGFTYAVTTLAGSVRRTFSGDIPCHSLISSNPTITASVTLAPRADGRPAILTIDEHRAEIVRFAAARTFPDVPVPQPTFDPKAAGWPLVFQDDFGGAAINTNEWFVPPWRRKTASMAHLDGRGHLVIEASPDAKEKGAVASTGLWSRRAFRYGYFEARLKFTKLPCWWAAFWLYGMSNNNPFLDGLEIDIFEDYTTRSSKRISHNMHCIHPGETQVLKSWSCHSELPGSLDDWYVVGCKWTPFEISEYIDGKLMRATQPQRGHGSVTFDAFNTAACPVPLHVIFSGQSSIRTKGTVDLSQYSFPECFTVDSVSVYAWPDAGKGPGIRWTSPTGSAVVHAGDELHFSVAVETVDAPVTAVYLFDTGYPMAFKTEPPYDFRIPFTKDHYETTQFGKPGISGIPPPLEGSTHAFIAFARDAKGRISQTAPVLRVPAAVARACSRPKDWRAFVRSGDAFSHDVVAPAAGRYLAGIRYVAGADLPFDNRIVVMVDGIERGVLSLPYNAQPPKPIAIPLDVTEGPHRLTFVPIGLFNVYGIVFERKGCGEEERAR